MLSQGFRGFGGAACKLDSGLFITPVNKGVANKTLPADPDVRRQGRCLRWEGEAVRGGRGALTYVIQHHVDVRAVSKLA